MQNALIETEKNKTTEFNLISQEIEKSRAIQEVQGAIFMARQFPRNIEISRNRILASAKSPLFAEQALYAYPRGGSMIMGPSIRAAETLANNWGNLLFGSKTLSQSLDNHVSEVMTYCWDLETNVRSEKTFKVQLVREANKGQYVLSSSRDIYEKEANDASRRLRACILAIIPQYITEEFVKACEKTLIGDSEKTLEERIGSLLLRFEKIGISKEMIEKKVGVGVDKFVAKNIVMLGSIHNSINNGYAPANQFFQISDEEQKHISKTLENLKKQKRSEKNETVKR